MTEMLPANVDRLNLPATYLAARQAIEKCAEVDEVKQIQDQATAIRVYAAQRDDNALVMFAQRIKLRAVRRIGELQKQIQPQPGKRTDIEPSGGAPTRLQVATDAGLSRDQMHQALRVASIPEDEFEREVESDTPPTVNALAERGITPRPRPNDRPAKFREDLEALERFDRWLTKTDAVQLARGCSDEDTGHFEMIAKRIEDWANLFKVSLPRL